MNTRSTSPSIVTPGPGDASFDGPFLYAIRLAAGTAMAMSLCLGVAAIRRRDIPRHRARMLHGYALGLGAGTQVATHLPWYLLPDMQGELARRLLMAAGWAVNLALAEGSISHARYRAMADYSASPALAPAAPIHGEAAYRLYMKHTMPYLEKCGGRLLFFGRGGPFLIGPDHERWDAVMLVQQSSVAAFMAFAADAGYLAGLGHRTAALEDSRLLPIEEGPWGMPAESVLQLRG